MSDPIVIIVEEPAPPVEVITVAEQGPAGPVGPAGPASPGSTTFAALTDKATADLPAINTPLGTALSGKLSISGTAADVNPAGTSIASALSGKQPLDADLTAIAALTTTANGRALLTSANALTIGASASVSGSNTGDNAVNTRYSGLVTNATHTGDATGSTELTLATVNPNVGAWGSYAYTPTFTVDEKGRITSAGENPTQVSVYNVFDMGSGVASALVYESNTDGGFLTAGTGGTLPIERGGTGATTAGLARTALGSGATGDELFQAVTPAAARTILEMNRTRVTQAADLSNATTTFVDTDLVLTLEGGVDYLIRGQFDMVSTNAGTGFKIQLSTSQNMNALVASGSCVGAVFSSSGASVVALLTLTRSDFFNFTGLATRRVQAEFRLNLVATGTVMIRFAQNGGNAAPASVFKAGSFWTSERL